MSKIPVGVSQCLLGEQVRFDGGHKRSRYLTDVLSSFIEFRPVCPEVAIGLGVPRKPIRLMVMGEETRVVGVADPSLDVTDALVAQAELAVQQMPDICGYVFMQNSPSCGVFGMKRYRTNGYTMDAKGRGAYAKRFMELMPYLPVEEAGRLNDAGLRENFLTRVFAFHDFKTHLAQAPTAKKLIAFYSRYKYQVMAHHVPSYFEIGRFLSNLAGRDIESCRDQFFQLFMAALSHHATRKGNTNAMMHLRGYLKDILSTQDKQELSQLIDSYKAGMVPLVVPLTLLKHHLLKLDNPYLKAQTFWSPHPEQLGLRNYIVENV
ncbi:DUF523 and DUF1722 domain-containing protein [Cellvibrio sp. PSBB023]|uniref:YbgA family protein n=1 Tax=Cellvibrio sp. PSBB023 TaxID=1945512 RepID=UPI00098EF048|nr:DUF523 and DUF1722 domain-containing protein [Cellvibrio sp. PSBB023]AQT59475.1 hypothetical protein B0D95_04775 [Cellvibrio sp. PSBB023]